MKKVPQEIVELQMQDLNAAGANVVLLGVDGEVILDKTGTEAALKRATQARLPVADEKQLNRLCAKSERGTLTPKELDEYRTLAQRAQRLDVTRVEALAELVRLKGESVSDVMEEIGWEDKSNGAQSHSSPCTATSA